MTISFGTGNDYIHSGNWGYSWDTIYLNDGSDYVSMPQNAQFTTIYSGRGDDFIIGSSSMNVVWGEAGMDTIYGQGGNDYLFGGANNDQLLGDQGRDYLQGGAGGDKLWGGADGDYFNFQPNDSINAPGFSDTIMDWDVRYDFITMNVAGSSSNYGEFQTNSNDLAAIGNDIFNSSWRTTKDHVFAYNSSTDTGYLFSDTNGDNYFDNSIVIKGAGSASDMNYSDILV